MEILIAFVLVVAVLVVITFLCRPSDSPPPLTDQMKSLGFVWAKTAEGWREACDTCGGNCGQCGTSLGSGMPVSLGQIVKSGGWDKNPPAGLPRRGGT